MNKLGFDQVPNDLYYKTTNIPCVDIKTNMTV